MTAERKHQTTLADSVENRLWEWLRQNQLHFGDRLPKETELAEELQISRHIVREGISRLKALGLVEGQKRRGTVLCRPAPFSGFQKIAQANLFTAEDQRHFMELRVAIELGMCSFIYARRSPDKIRQLRKIAEATGVSEPQIKEKEVDFHSALMAFAENPAANDFRKVLMLVFDSIQVNMTPKTPLPSHSEICDVLEKGSVSEFQLVMQQHFIPYLNLV